MGMLVSTVAALSTFYPDAKNIFDPESQRKQTYRLIGKMPTLAAFVYRHSRGMPYAYPDNDLSYTGNFLNMLFKMTEVKYKPDPILEHGAESDSWRKASGASLSSAIRQSKRPGEDHQPGDGLGWQRVFGKNSSGRRRDGKVPQQPNHIGSSSTPGKRPGRDRQRAVERRSRNFLPSD